jgi:hypothetical protein
MTDNIFVSVFIFRIPYDFNTLPRTLCALLVDYELCAHCASPCLTNFGEIIVPRQLSANGVTVHVTAANQSFSVPVQERYCSIKCFNYGLKRAGRNTFSLFSSLIIEESVLGMAQVL